MIRVDNIVKYYGEHLALKGISYTINKAKLERKGKFWVWREKPRKDN